MQMMRASALVDIPENSDLLFDWVGRFLVPRVDQQCWLAVSLVMVEAADEKRPSRTRWMDMENRCLATVSEGMKLRYWRRTLEHRSI